MNLKTINLIDYVGVKNNKGKFVLSIIKNKTNKIYQLIVKPIKTFNLNKKNETTISFE